MSTTPTKSHLREQEYRTPKKHESTKAKTPKSKGLKAVENLMQHDNTTESSETNSMAEEPVEVLVEDPDDENVLDTSKGRRRSGRIPSPTKKYTDFIVDSGGGKRGSNRKRNAQRDEVTDEEEEAEEDADFVVDVAAKPKAGDLQLLEEEDELGGKVMFGFNTPKKKGGMALAAMNTPKTPATPKTPKTPGRLGKTPDGKRSKKSLEPKTPARVRNKVKNRKFNRNS